MVSVNNSQLVAGKRNAFDAQEKTFPPCKVCEMSRGGWGGSNLAAGVCLGFPIHQMEKRGSSSLEAGQSGACLHPGGYIYLRL